MSKVLASFPTVMIRKNIYRLLCEENRHVTYKSTHLCRQKSNEFVISRHWPWMCKACLRLPWNFNTRMPTRKASEKA
jgi:hypothetical protein